MDSKLIARAVLLAPSYIIQHLKAGFYKTYDYMLGVIRHSVQSVYNGWMGGEFVDILQSLIFGQMTQAYQQAWEDDGNTSLFLPDFLQNALAENIARNTNFDYLYQYYTDIIDARVDGTPIEPLLARASLWANRYTEAYNEANTIIASYTGGKMIWQLGATEQHCDTCGALHGIVAYANEWRALGVAPQQAPNSALSCGGWRCDCQLTATNERKTRNAVSRIQSAIN